MNTRSNVFLAIIVLLCTTGLTDAVPQASFHGLGDLPGGAIGSSARGISPDGTAVAGDSRSEFGRQAYYWTNENGIVGLGYLPGSKKDSRAYSVSNGGSVVVGWSDTFAGAFRWTSESGMVSLGGRYSYAIDVSADGSVVVGYSDGRGFRWTFDSGMVGLGGGHFSDARSVSADGSVVVGYSGHDLGVEAFRWTEESGTVRLGDLSGGSFFSWAECVSADGATVVGKSNSAFGREAFRWTAGYGMTGLGDLPGGKFDSAALGVSGDGSKVVGYSKTSIGKEAFIWDEFNGMRNLKAVLNSDYGLDLSGWALHEAREISSDGLTIVGNGVNPERRGEAWIVTIQQLSTPPVANAGDDQTVYACADGMAEIKLDGSGSYDDDGDELTYLWNWIVDSNEMTATGVDPNVLLPIGEHTIELIVNDGLVDSEPNEVIITVIGAC